MTELSKRDAVEAALGIAEQITLGSLDPAALESEVVTACRELFGTVVGPDDPLWELQVEVARGVLAVGGGLNVDEQAEWLALARRRASGVSDEPDMKG